MRLEKRNQKARAARNKANIASVTKEMAKPPMAESARIKTDKHNKPGDGEPE